MNTFLIFLERCRFLLLANLLLLVPVLIDLNITVGAGPESKFRLFEYGILLTIFFSIPLWGMGRWHLAWNTGSLAIALWIVYILVRASVDPHFEFAMDTAIRMVAWLSFALLIADVCTTEKQFFRMVWIGALGQMGPVILAIGNTFGQFIYLQWIKGLPWRWQNDLIGAERGIIWSSLGQPNFYANYGAMLLIWLIALLFLSCRWWSRSLLVIYISALLYTLAYTFTRGIWASLIPTGLFILSLWTYRQIHNRVRWIDLLRNYGKYGMTGGIGMMILIGSIYGIESPSGPLHYTGQRIYHALTLRDTSMRARPLMWYAALRMWKEKPVWGQGIGQYAPRYLGTVYQAAQESDPVLIQHVTREMNTIRTDETHNDYLQILAETGLTGYAFFLFVLLSLIFTTVHAMLFKRLSYRPSVLLMGCLAVVVMTSIQCLYDFPLLLPASAILFSLATGGILILSQDDQPRTKSSLVWVITRWSLCIIMLPVLLFTAGFVLRHLCATHEHSKGASFMQNGTKLLQTNIQESAIQFQKAQRYFEQADRLFPGNGAFLLDLGRLYAYLQGVYPNQPQYRSRAIHFLERSKETYCVPELYHWLCSLYLDEKRFTQAQNMADVLLLIDPDRKDAQLLAGQVAYALGDFEKAVTHLQEELRVNPTNVQALAYLGSLYKDRFHQWPEAAQTYERLLEIEPGSIDAHENLADVLVQLGNDSNARSHYEKALEGSHANNLKAYEQRIETKLRDLRNRVQQQEGKSHESR